MATGVHVEVVVVSREHVGGVVCFWVGEGKAFPPVEVFSFSPLVSVGEDELMVSCFEGDVEAVVVWVVPVDCVTCSGKVVCLFDCSEAVYCVAVVWAAADWRAVGFIVVAWY